MLILTLGIAASGKTTWSKDYSNRNKDIIRLSVDELRGFYVDSPRNDSKDNEVWAAVIFTTKHLLTQGKSVLVDGLFYRKVFRQELKNFTRDKQIHFRAAVFNTPLETCLARNSARINPFFSNKRIEYQHKMIDQPFDLEFDSVELVVDSR